MAKNLSDMTLEELWQLFPIFLTEHNVEWTNIFKQMEILLKKELHEKKIVRISHIGSTAIKSIWAKPIIDILLEISFDEDMKTVSESIVNIGFIKMSESPTRISFNYGYTSEGFADKVFHLHLRYSGDNNELYFRDYLNEHPTIAREYETLKIELWHKFEHNRDSYTSGKDNFVNKYTMEAKKEYLNRYV